MTKTNQDIARTILANNGGIDVVDDPQLFNDIVKALTEAQKESKESDMLEESWGIICNVEGDQRQEWNDAMYRFRERYFKFIYANRNHE